MRIGILTLPLHTNYGGIIQAYALQTVLEKMGHEASHILTKYTALPYYQGLGQKDIDMIRQHTDRFIDTYIHGKGTSLPAVNDEGYEGIVVGSDQIWSHMICSYMLGSYPFGFLSFAKDWNIKRVAYAASFGKDTWEAPADVTAQCKTLAEMFDAVSVREDSGVRLCREHLGVADAKHVLDPTLLLTMEDYCRLIETAETEEIPPHSLMNYVLDRTADKLLLISDVEKAYGLSTFSTNSRVEDVSAPLEQRIQPPLEQWLRSFRDADMVITDSFHATVFSIIFHKRFIVTGNPMRGLARIYSLLGALGLEDHLVLDASQLDTKKDYSIPATAYQKLGELRNYSLDYLKNALN